MKPQPQLPLSMVVRKAVFTVFKYGRLFASMIYQHLFIHLYSPSQKLPTHSVLFQYVCPSFFDSHCNYSQGAICEKNRGEGNF